MKQVKDRLPQYVMMNSMLQFDSHNHISPFPDSDFPFTKFVSTEPLLELRNVYDF